MSRLRVLPGLSIVTYVLAFAAGGAFAEDLFLADGSVHPGQLWLSEGFTADRAIHYREPRPNPAYPRAIMKLAQTAVDSEGKIYFCSGLDGSLMHLLDGRNEIQVLEVEGQVRDLACTGETHTLYYSTVATPQEGAALADGTIWRRDFYDGRPTVLATIRQADIGGQWWGAFTIKGGHAYIATLHEPSRLYKLTSDGPVRVYEGNRHRITGFAAGAGDDFFFTTGSGKVYRTTDFATVEPVLETSHRLSDVTLRAGADWARP